MTGSQGEFGRSKQQLGMHDAMPRRIAVGQRRTDRSCLRSLPCWPRYWLLATREGVLSRSRTRACGLARGHWKRKRPAKPAVALKQVNFVSWPLATYGPHQMSY
jgi:hypothetical protein